MDAEVVIASSAAVIALAALGLSVYQARLDWEHKRLSVRPVLVLGTAKTIGGVAGVHLQNVGLGPANIVETEVWLDGQLIGSWDRSTAPDMVTRSGMGWEACTIRHVSYADTQFDDFIYSISPFDPEANKDFAALLDENLDIRLSYESLYGEDMGTVSLKP